MSQCPGPSQRRAKRKLDAIASLAPVAANVAEEPLFSPPQIGAAGDVAEQRSGTITFFEAHQRREALAVNGKLAEGTPVGRGILGKEDGCRQEDLGLGQGLTDVNAKALGLPAALRDQGALIRAGEQDDF
jgi:hypothetical protein